MRQSVEYKPSLAGAVTLKVNVCCAWGLTMSFGTGSSATDVMPHTLLVVFCEPSALLARIDQSRGPLLLKVTLKLALAPVLRCEGIDCETYCASKPPPACKLTGIWISGPKKVFGARRTICQVWLTTPGVLTAVMLKV